MRAVRHSRFGLPADVAELAELPEPGAPAAGEVLLAGELAPIHPADLLALEGRYGARRPALPAFCGTDGVGRVVAVGAGVDHLRVGDRVPLMLAGSPTWRERFVAKAGPLPSLTDADPETVAALGVNALTAWALLTGMMALGPGDWIVQNAAGSSVGRAVSAFARHIGVRSVGVVRRIDAVATLRAEGADVVLLDGPDLPSRLAEATGGAAPCLGLDAVGGEATQRLANAVARGGTVVTYGLLSGEPCRIDGADAIFRDVALRGFWLAGWLRRQSPAEVASTCRRLAGLLAAFKADGTILDPIAAIHPLGEIRQALNRAAEPGRSGKVLLRLS